MTTASHEHARRKLYNHARSKEARRAPAPPDEVEKAHLRHLDEKNRRVDDNKREMDDFDWMVRREKAADTKYHAGRGDAVYDKERHGILARQAQKREAQERRHGARSPQRCKLRLISSRVPTGIGIITTFLPVLFQVKIATSHIRSPAFGLW
jgi:hypothetical protein